MLSEMESGVQLVWRIMQQCVVQQVTGSLPMSGRFVVLNAVAGRIIITAGPIRKFLNPNYSRGTGLADPML